MISTKQNQAVVIALGCALCAFVCGIAPAQAGDDDGPSEHFYLGEARSSLSWDNISAMETGVLKFGGSAGIHVLNGIEVGFEQQFIVPVEIGTQARSWGYLRVVPFRNWYISPFFAARVGYYFLPENDAVGVGGGCGAVMFVDDHIAFEASLFYQAVFHPLLPIERQTEFDWRVVIFF
ncbi:MAG: hypothetical protein JRJ87_24440 [Deltaproteobacteria bacterium]|nr:hypothetical protein [Deltaproteobacteria bacterium]